MSTKNCLENTVLSFCSTTQFSIVLRIKMLWLCKGEILTNKKSLGKNLVIFGDSISHGYLFSIVVNLFYLYVLIVYVM